MLKGRISKKRKYLSIMFIPGSTGKIKTLRLRGFCFKLLILAFILTSTYLGLGYYISNLTDKNVQLRLEVVSLLNSEKTQRELIAEKADELDMLQEHKENVTAAILEFGEGYDDMVKTFLRDRLETSIASRSDGIEEQAIDFIKQSKELYGLLDEIKAIETVEENALDDVEDARNNLEVYLDTLPTFWPTNSKVHDGFGYRIHPITKVRTFHYGLDIGGAYNDPVYAAGKGTIIFSGYKKGYGNSITIEHKYADRINLITTYSHLNKKLVVKGQLVEKGEQIALIGSTGLSTGPHLHFEIRLENNTAIDPLGYLDINETK